MNDLFSSWSVFYDTLSSLHPSIAATLGAVGMYFLTKLKKIRDLLKKVISKLFDWFQFVLGKFLFHHMRGWVSLKRYCKIQLKKSEFTTFLIPSRTNASVNIDEIFVRLNLEQHGKAEKTFNHNNLLEAGNRIQIIGDPGSGKSSLVKKVFRDHCKKAARRPGKAMLPIFFELKTLKDPGKTKKLGEWLLKAIREKVKSTNAFEMEECFKSYVESSGLLLLLDGLDEVSGKFYPKIEKALNELHTILSDLSPNNSMILTMRAQFHFQVESAYRSSFGPVLTLNPFSPSDIYEFLTKWKFPKETEENETLRIFNDLSERPSLRELCSNPLILSMYVAEDQGKGEKFLPESRTEFFSRVTEELLIKRRKEQLTTIIAPGKLKEQRERILGQLALEHMLDFQQSANLLAWEDGIKVVKQVIECGDDEAEEYFEHLMVETGLIQQERLRETFRFIHLHFCEFFAAYEAVNGQEKGWESLLQAQQNIQTEEISLYTRLLEVFPFACGILPYRQKKEGLNEIILLKNRLLTGKCFLETKSYELPDWSPFTQEMKNFFLETPAGNWDLQWFGELHLFSIVVNDAEKSASHFPSIEKFPLEDFFQQLIQENKEKLKKLLSIYVQHAPASIFRFVDYFQLDLARDFPKLVQKNLDQKPFFDAVIEYAKKSPHTHLWASIFTEAGLKSKVIANWLKEQTLFPHWEKEWKEIPVKKRWCNVKKPNSIMGGVIFYFRFENTFLSQCLSLSLNGKKTFFTSSSQTIQFFSSRKPPKTSIFHYFRTKIFTYLVFFTTIIMFYFLIVPGSEGLNFLKGILPKNKITNIELASLINMTEVISPVNEQEKMIITNFISFVNKREKEGDISEEEKNKLFFLHFSIVQNSQDLRLEKRILRPAFYLWFPLLSQEKFEENIKNRPEDFPSSYIKLIKEKIQITKVKMFPLFGLMFILWLLPLCGLMIVESLVLRFIDFQLYLMNDITPEEAPFHRSKKYRKLIEQWEKIKNEGEN